MVTRRSLLCGSALVGAAAAARALRAGDAGGDVPLRLSEAEWRGRLGPARFAVLRGGAAEPAWSSPLVAEARRGLYGCAGCGADLFPSASKYDAGTGWPSFWAPFFDAVAEGRSVLALGTAARCTRCGGHLGLVRAEAPTPTGLSYRVDGLALSFRPAPDAAHRRS